MLLNGGGSDGSVVEGFEETGVDDINAEVGIDDIARRSHYVGRARRLFG